MQIGDIIKGQIKSTRETGIVVELKESFLGFVHISDVSDYYVYSISSMFKIDNTYEFLVIEINEIDKRVKLGWKQIMPRFLKSPFEFKIQETKKGFKNLAKETNKWLN